MLQVLCDSSNHCSLVDSQARCPRPLYQPSKNYNMYPVNYTLYRVPSCWLLVSLIVFLSPLSRQRQTRGQEEKEEDREERGGLVHLPMFLMLWSVGHSDSQTGSNLTMSSTVFNYNINTKNMSNKFVLGMHTRKKTIFSLFCVYFTPWL